MLNFTFLIFSYFLISLLIIMQNSRHFLHERVSLLSLRINWENTDFRVRKPGLWLQRSHLPLDPFEVSSLFFLDLSFLIWKMWWSIQSSSVQFSRSVVSDSLQPHESQHARPPCPSPTPRVHSDSRPSSQWCHPAISPSVVPFSSCPQSLPASDSFPMSQLFARGGQSTGVSASASFLPKESQGWSPSEWTGWKALLLNPLI